MNRRQLLLSGAALIGCKGRTDTDTDPATAEPPTPAPAREPSPPPYQPAETVDEVAFPWGVLVGDPFGGGAEIRVRTPEPSVSVALYAHDGSAWSEVDRVSVDAHDGAAAHRFEGLDAGVAYCAVAYAHGARSAVSRFRTAPAPGELIELRIGASSCFGLNGGPMQNLTYTPESDLDFFVQLGDFGYLDGSLTTQDYLEAWDRYLQRDGPLALFTGAALVHTWDDHEVSNNWTLEPGTEDSIDQELLDTAAAVWRQVIPMAQGQGPFGIWRRMSWGDIADVFVLDCRGERHGDGIVSEEQLAWFEGEMVASTAVFKLVLASVHVTDHTELFSIAQQQDRWQGYPAQRARLVATCANTPGTLVLTGDMHYGAVQRVDPQGAPGQDLYEVAAGPSGSRLLPAHGIAEVAGHPAQYETLVEAWTWSEIVLNPGDGRVTVRFVGDDGETVAEQVLFL